MGRQRVTDTLLLSYVIELFCHAPLIYEASVVCSSGQQEIRQCTKAKIIKPRVARIESLVRSYSTLE